VKIETYNFSSMLDPFAPSGAIAHKDSLARHKQKEVKEARKGFLRRKAHQEHDSEATSASSTTW
jgi:hypothetical protein